MEETAREWWTAKEVIKKFLKDLIPNMSDLLLEHNAAAIIARLAQHDPPMLIVYNTNVKE